MGPSKLGVLWKAPVVLFGDGFRCNSWDVASWFSVDRMTQEYDGMWSQALPCWALVSDINKSCKCREEPLFQHPFQLDRAADFISRNCFLRLEGIWGIHTLWHIFAQRYMATAQVDYAANLQPGTEPPIFEVTDWHWLSLQERIRASTVWICFKHRDKVSTITHGVSIVKNSDLTWLNRYKWASWCIMLQQQCMSCEIQFYI